jgi:hypothetical protein
MLDAPTHLEYIRCQHKRVEFRITQIQEHQITQPLERSVHNRFHRIVTQTQPFDLLQTRELSDHLRRKKQSVEKR